MIRRFGLMLHGVCAYKFLRAVVDPPEWLISHFAIIFSHFESVQIWLIVTYHSSNKSALNDQYNNLFGQYARGGMVIFLHVYDN